MFEAFREMAQVPSEELRTDGWHTGGRPFTGPGSPMAPLGKSKAVAGTINGHSASPVGFAVAVPAALQLLK